MWDLHSFYTNQEAGLISHLRLSKEEEKKLKNLRQTVRLRITQVFQEAVRVAHETMKEELTKKVITLRLSRTFVRYLSLEEQSLVAELISGMEAETLKEFINLKPRFMTQGSFKYKTLNRPLHQSQEMDIDDGTYLPMSIFESKPKIGHQLLTLLVDSALKSLANENPGWKFEAKRTCGRIKIQSEYTHIDVPMYAIPKDKFEAKEVISMASSMEADRWFLESASNSADKLEEKLYKKLDSKSVNLALRSDKLGSPKWMNSDPKVVEDWFLDECKRLGPYLRDVCRFMKAWRDAQWDLGGPSSISLMAATVNILHKKAHDSCNIASVVKVVAENLPHEFRMGVESPDETDERPLFPPESEHNEREKDIINKLEKFSTLLIEAENAETRRAALDLLSKVFGNRVTDYSLIKEAGAAIAYKSEATKGDAPAQISKTMVSG